MAEMVLPGTYIEVRSEGLIVPGRVSVGNIGMVGTASKGPVGVAVAIGSYAEAKDVFGDYDAWNGGGSNELTLVRALEIAYSHGATTVYAVRIGAGTPAAAAHRLLSGGNPAVVVTARSPGTWGNGIKVQVTAAEEDAYVQNEIVDMTTLTLAHPPEPENPRNRIKLEVAGTTTFPTIVQAPATPSAGQVAVDSSTGQLTFPTAPPAGAVVTASYVVDTSNAVTVSVKHGSLEERYTAASSQHLVSLSRDSALVQTAVATGAGTADPADLPDQTPSPVSLGSGGDNTPGSNGEAATDPDYRTGLDALLNEDAHIIVGAGRDVRFGDELNGHVQLASTDALRRDRVAVVGSASAASLDQLRGHNLDSDRVIYVAPGIVFGDSAKREDVTLPGSYAAAAVAGLLSSYAPHQSLTNKTLNVGGLQHKYTPTQLTQLLQSRVLPLEVRQGHRVVRGITTSSNTAWTVITTRRIVDYAKAGVRSAANPYIGLLNNERVRTALRSTIASFLNEMLDDEMLIAYELDVTAEREDQIKGIVKVTMSLQPTFSIEFIKVTMFLG